MFVEAEYADPPCMGLETREADRTWLGCTAYTHAARGDGGETYEELGGGYRGGAGGAPPGGPGGRAAPELLEGDGDVVPTRWARQRGGGRAHGRGGEPGAAKADQVAPAAGPQLARRFLPFEEAQAVARYAGQAGLSGNTEWRAWCKEGMCPRNVPRRPDKTYKNAGWQGWGHWLGTGNTQRGTEQFLPFEEALAAARSLGLPGRMEWWAWCKEGSRPPNVPSNPNRVYKDHGWQGWRHWLGTGNQLHQKKNFLPFGQALRVARQLRLVSQKEWKRWCRTGARPANMPTHPETAYVHDGWMGWVHWLYHANLGPAPAPAVAPTARNRTAPGRSQTTPGKGGGKRQRR